MDPWVKSSIRRGYVDPCGTQIRLIFPDFEYCLDCREKSSAEYSILWEHPLNSFNHFRVRPWKFFLPIFFFSFFRNGTRQHLSHTYIASLFSPVTLARRRITNTRITNTRMLPHGPSSLHSYTIVTSVRSRDETKRHKAMSA